MKDAPIPPTEKSRIRALHSLELLDTGPESIYERTTLIAKQAFNVPMACVCLVDSSRVWFKSAQGVDIAEIDRDISICGHAINQSITDDPVSRLFEINDTKTDLRFIDNPLVLNAPMVRYYLGYVLQSIEGENLGTLCIMDTHPRATNKNDQSLLIELGKMIDERLKEIQRSYNLDFDDVAVASNVVYRVFEEMEAMLKKKGISLAEWRILDKVAQSNFATPTKISKQLNLATSQISRALELLEAKGFISRIRSVENCDRRLVKLECNEEGRELWSYGKRLGKEVVGKLGLH